MLLLIRKIFRFLKTGSFQTKDYKNYRDFLSLNKRSYQKGYFNLTIDFELAWSRSRRGNSSTTLKESLERSRRVREFTPILVSLSEKYNIPVTFATVGHVALKDCSEHSSTPNFKPNWIKNDWYGVDPHTSIKENKDYYGADLVEKIVNSKVKHSIAGHSFSHVDLGDSETTKNIAQFEVTECFKILKNVNPKLTTYVFVKNHPAYEEIIKNAGFTIYRNNKNHEIRKDDFGLTQFPLGLWISPEAYTPEDLNRLIELAINRKQLINIWCHLYEFKSSSQFYNFFDSLFSYIDLSQKTNMIRALNMEDIVSEVTIK